MIVKRTLAIIAVVASLGLAGCADTQSNRVVGGAALGGVAGNLLTGGSAIGTIGGAAAGGLIGNSVNSNENDRRHGYRR